MKKDVGKFLYWTPRILSIIFIAFLSMFSLDVFDARMAFWQTAGALFIHNIPSIILALILYYAWKREIFVAIAFFLGGLLYIFLAFWGAKNWLLALAWSIEISGVAFLVGGLFLANWIKKRD